MHVWLWSEQGKWTETVLYQSSDWFKGWMHQWKDEVPEVFNVWSDHKLYKDIQYKVTYMKLIDEDEFIKNVVKYKHLSTKTIGEALGNTPAYDIDADLNKAYKNGFEDCRKIVLQLFQDGAGRMDNYSKIWLAVDDGSMKVDEWKDEDWWNWLIT